VPTLSNPPWTPRKGLRTHTLRLCRARDVLANLFAAAIIYLIGVYVGLFQAHTATIVVSVIIAVIGMNGMINGWVVNRPTTGTCYFRWASVSINLSCAGVGAGDVSRQRVCR
jgi:hypothetical protein